METIPWYRTRTFWSIVMAVLVAWSVFFYFWAFQNKANSAIGHLGYVLYSFGSALLSMWGYYLFGIIGGIISTLIYLFLQAALIYKTFQSTKVRLRYPFILLALYLSGITMALFFLGSFN